MAFLFDTDVLIDHLRYYEPALRLFAALPKEGWHVSCMTELELFQGAVNKHQEQLVRDMLSRFKILAVDRLISEQARNIYRHYHWTIPMEIPDAFIATTAINHKLRLITQNIKDFDGIPSLVVQKPY